MTKDEMKNRISLALKDPILQQGFEIICKNLAEFEKENAELKEKYDTCLKENTGLKIHNAYIEKKLPEATELLKKFIYLLKDADYTFVLKNAHLMLAEAEQFLNLKESE